MPSGVYKRTNYNKGWFKKGKKYFPENHPAWKGKKVGYAGLHLWLKRNFGKAIKCKNINCKYPKGKFEWALKKDCEYERKRENFFMLCQSCHKKYDFTEETRKKMSIKGKLRKIKQDKNGLFCK
jgi:hypothetical protein